MKNAIQVIFLIAILSGQTWEVLYTYPDANLNDVFFVDTSNGWIVGREGIILHSKNAGYSWHNHSIETDDWFYGVYFPNIDNGWIVGDNGLILYTSDAGTTWAIQESGTSYWLKDVFFLDDSIGWAVGGSNTFEGIILRTENGGKNWSIISEGLSGVFLGVHFINNHEGWVVGGVSLFDNFDDEVIWHTTDGGGSWEEQVSPTTGPLIKVFFLDADAGWAVGFNEVVIRTGNGGTNWTPVNVKEGPITANLQFTDIAIPDRNNIWVIDLENIYHSIDGGLSWDVEWSWSQTINPFSYLGMSVVDSIHGWVVGDTTVLGYSFEVNSISDIIDEHLPVRTSLIQNYPNPFNSSTIIAYRMPTRERITLAVYDVAGRELRRLVNSTQSEGEHFVVWDGKDDEDTLVPSGIYFYRIEAGSFYETRKLVLLR